MLLFFHLNSDIFLSESPEYLMFDTASREGKDIIPTLLATATIRIIGELLIVHRVWLLLQLIDNKYSSFTIIISTSQLVVLDLY